MIEFAWKDVKSYEVDEEGMSFSFEYNRPGKKPRVVKILTPYVSLLFCVEKKTFFSLSSSSAFPSYISGVLHFG